MLTKTYLNTQMSRAITIGDVLGANFEERSIEEYIDDRRHLSRALDTSDPLGRYDEWRSQKNVEDWFDEVENDWEAKEEEMTPCSWRSKCKVLPKLNPTGPSNLLARDRNNQCGQCTTRNRKSGLEHQTDNPR